MKEYKVKKANLGWKNVEKKLEDMLNEQAISGWILKETKVVGAYYFLIFEREKHR